MSTQDVIAVVIRRWWIIVATTALAVLAALTYTHHQERLYQASATVFAHPSAAITKPSEVTGDVGLLTYGSLAETFASLAQSHAMLAQTGNAMGLSAQALTHYSVEASTIPNTSVIQASIIGPDPVRDAQLANALVRRVAVATSRYFRVFTLTPLDDATVPTTPTQPRPTRIVLTAIVLGLILGLLAAIASLRMPPWLSTAPSGSYSGGGRPVPHTAARSEQLSADAREGLSLP